MSFSSITLLSPAKVNLALHITGKDTNSGYHFLESVVVFPEWGDIITISHSDDMSLSINGLSDHVPIDENNLIIKAYNALSRHVGYALPKTHIELDKKIPVQAGLGGGSSNAATCLLIWKRLFSLDISLEVLTDIARHIGADVPVCLHRTPCLMEGFGEKITPLPITGQNYSMIIAKPENGADTADIFQKLKKKNNPSLSKDIAQNQLLHHALTCGRNDLSPIAITDTPDIASLHAVLNRFDPLKCDVTGSGSASFALFDNAQSSHNAFDALRQSFPDIFSINTRIIL